MASDKKTTTGSAQPVSQVEAEAADEIDEIMNEIQNLQANMAEAPKAKAAPVAKLKPVAVVEAAPAPIEEDTGVEEFRGSDDDASMEETLGSMEQEPHNGGVLDVGQETDENVQEPEETVAYEADEMEDEEGEREIMAKNNESEDGANEGNLTMTLSGSMTMKLKYECDGQEVTVGFANGSLKVQLADGTEFKIPVARGGKLRAAA